MRQYLDLLQDVKTNGSLKADRTGTGTTSVFGRQIRFNLSEGFPAVTTKKLFLRGIIHELLWFLQGSSNIEYLVQNNVNIWNEWPFKAYLKATNQPVPESNSEQWSKQLTDFIEKIKTDHEFALKYGELGPVYGYQWRHWPTPEGGHIDQIQQAIDAIEAIKKNPDDSRGRRVIVSAWNTADIEEMAKAGLPPISVSVCRSISPRTPSLR